LYNQNVRTYLIRATFLGSFLGEWIVKLYWFWA